jgi:beta-galactosidase
MTTRRSEVLDGVLTIDGTPHYLASAEYPYYRDDPANWDDRLRRIRSLGFRFVTFYVPWRHHELTGVDGVTYDFTGASDPARDVVRFVGACERAGLYLIAKPGPFVHAELDYGGLPDRVCPLEDPSIEPMRGHDGEALKWTGGAPRSGGGEEEHWPLPAPFDPTFLSEVDRWLRAVAEEVLRPFAYPDGPIVALQLANEGIYCDAQRPVWTGDASGPSLERFRRFLDERGDELASGAPPARGRPVDRAAWAAFLARHFGAFVGRLGEPVNVDLPVFVNVNPPLAEPHDVDAWLSRVEPEAWPGIAYGFTDWIGVPSKDPSVVDRYELMVKRSRGPNLEENWGLSDLYDGAYASGAVCLHQTLLSVALGATGYNVFPAAVTQAWSSDLDRWHPRPYAPSAPIGLAGELTERAELLTLLNAFIDRWGSALLVSRPLSDVAWVLQLDDAHANAWPDSTVARRSSGDLLLAFFREAREAHLDPQVINAAAATGAELAAWRYLVATSGRRMAAGAQRLLAGYVRSGGRLILIGALPVEDEAGRLCDELSGEAGIERVSADDVGGSAVVAALQRAGLRSAVSSTSRAGIWVRQDRDGDAQVLIVLTDTNHEGPIDFQVQTSVGSWDGAIDLPPGSSAIVRVERGRLAGALVKGVNEHLGAAVAPGVRIGVDEVRASAPADLLVMADASDWKVQAVGARRDLVVRLPGGSQVVPTSALDLLTGVEAGADRSTR